MEQKTDFSIEEVKSFSNNIVQKHFDKMDISLLKMILSEVRGDMQEYLFDLKQLEGLGFELQEKENNLFDSLKKIAGFYIELQSGYGDKRQIGLIENEFTVDQETNVLSIKVNKELIPFLIGLKDQYTPLTVEQ